MDSLDLLRRRRSTPSRLLREPGPSEAQWQALLAAAVHVPDHGRLTPWRFLRIQGEARQALGELLARRRREIEPTVADAAVEKDRQRFNHAPAALAVIARLTPDHKVPEQEQLLSGGAACFSLLLAAEALGLGAQWLTGWAAYDPMIASSLGLHEHERVLGFVHFGTAAEAAPERERPEPMSLLSDWRPL